jgi:hypothetical protein
LPLAPEKSSFTIADTPQINGTMQFQDFIWPRPLGFCTDSAMVDLHDALTLIGAIVIVALLSTFYSPAVPGDEQCPSPPTLPAPPVPSPPPATPSVPVTPDPALPQPEPVVPDPVRITYAGDHLAYPVHTLPANMNVFGASDPEWQWRFKETVVFAYLREPVGGLTDTFSVPYPVWRVNSSLNATTIPQYALLQWVLVDAETGEILEGGELRHGGSMTKNLQVSHKEVYFIVHTRYADSFTLSLETTTDYLPG